MSNVFFRHQFPRRCPGRFTMLQDDLHGAGLGWTGKLMAFVLIIAKEESGGSLWRRRGHTGGARKAPARSSEAPCISITH
eukprot:1774583-Prymnesium_polylepis.2